jgi:copper chaperone CopZ
MPFTYRRSTMHSITNDLGLTDAHGGCSCSTTDHSADNVAASSTVTEDYLVTGMTCSHCVASVTEGISAIEGVDGVQVDLQVGSNSRVTISSAAPIDAAAVRAAVEEAGYSVAATS